MEESMKDRMARIKKNQRIAAEALHEVDKVIDPMEKEIDEIFTQKWGEMFPGVENYHIASLRGGCHVINWEPAVYVYHINDVVPIDDGRWAKQNSGRKYYKYNTTFVECPVNAEKLQKFMDYIEQKTLVPVQFAKQKFQTSEALGRLRDVEDLQCKFGPFEVLQNEKVWYMGWEIEDSFVIGRFPGGHIEIYYSTNGHGFGYDIRVEAGESIELERFYNYLETNDASAKVSKEEVLKSWEVA